MLYLVTEDSTSGREFWNCVFSTFLDSNKYTLVDFLKTSSGISITGNK